MVSNLDLLKIDTNGQNVTFTTKKGTKMEQKFGQYEVKMPPIPPMEYVNLSPVLVPNKKTGEIHITMRVNPNRPWELMTRTISPLQAVRLLNKLNSAVATLRENGIHIPKSE